MQILILSVGKRSDQNTEALIQQYEDRLGRDHQLQWQFVAGSKSSDELSVRREESATLSKYVRQNDKVILLDERGKQFNNKAFAQTFEKLSLSQGRIVFVIGGAYGVSEEFRNNSSLVWSFSLLVFPHRMIRLILMEQLYRTIMITKGHPYHHE